MTSHNPGQTMHESISEVDPDTDEVMDDVGSLESLHELAAPPVNFSRARRWSLDVISPKKLFSKKEVIPTVGPIIASSKPEATPRLDRRFSSPNVKVKRFKFKQPNRFFQQQQQHHDPQRGNKESYLILNMENQDTVLVTCDDDEHAKSLIQSAILEQRVLSYRMVVSSTKAAIKINAGLTQRSKSCDNLAETAHGYDDDDDNDAFDVTTFAYASDARHRIVTDMLETERKFCDRLHTLNSAYGEPMGRLSLFNKGDHAFLFGRISRLHSLSMCLIQKLTSALDTWDRQTTRIGPLFPSTLWSLYEDYCRNVGQAERLLEDQASANPAVKELCEKIKQKQGTQSLSSLLTLPVTRITDYGKYLSGLLADTDPSHPDFGDLSLAVAKVDSMVKDREDEVCGEVRPDKEVEQDASSNDTIYQPSTSSKIAADIVNINNNNNNNEEEERDKQLSKHKGMSLRRMSAPSAVLFKSLSGYKSKSPNSLWSNSSMGRKEYDFISAFNMADSESSRMFVMEGAVQFATGMQIQERYIFLFNDFMLVTKQKTSTTFKLKHKVQLCDVWLASCLEEVAETTRPADRSFVIGWPTLNVVATFPRPDIRDYWLSKLQEYIKVEKMKDKDKQITLKVAPRVIESGKRNICHVQVNNLTEAKDVLLASLSQLNISEHEGKDYQLWVLSGKEGSPYPLIGHETPFSIKLSHFRGLSRSRSGDDIDDMTAADLESMVANSSSTAIKCEFYLKQKKSVRKNHYEDSALSKSSKKNKKSQNIFHTLFRKKRPANRLVFGLPLSEVCDENCDPPEAIVRLMVLVYQQGPRTPGILRRGNKATLSKEIKEKIDSGEKYTLADHYAPTAASVFKEFLRSIPGGLLMNDLHSQWTTVKKDDPHGEKITKIKTILGKLPPAHYRTVKLTMSLLQHLAKHSSQNQMGPSNLATCIAPSLYTRGAMSPLQGNLKGDALKQMNMQDSVSEIQNVIVPLVSFMIINHIELFGEDILSLFTKYGCQASPAMSLHEDRPELQLQPSLEEDEEDELAAEEEHDDGIGFSSQHQQKHHRLQTQQLREQMQRDSNSGTDSDSMHSVLSMQETEMGLRHNDSSIDSLVEREYYLHEAESSPKAVKSHISPSNLSRDSGLTLSDTQLYDEEACQRDTVVVPTRLYQRSASHYTDSDSTEAYEQNNYYPSVGGQLGRSVNPVAPPRKRVIRKGRDSNEESYDEQHELITYFRHRAPFNHSLSTTQLDNKMRPEEVRPQLSHPFLSQRVSSDSIGEEGEGLEEQFHAIQFDRIRATADIGTVIKSEKGSHLFLNEQALPTKYSLGVSGSKFQHRFVRQSSVTDSTPPVSPQSRYSQSSRDSAISDSVYSVSQDESIHSTPQTPDEIEDTTLTWVPDIAIPEKPWAGKLIPQNSDNKLSLPYSKSTSDLLSGYAEDSCTTTDSSEQTPRAQPSPKLWSGKFHEAEEIEFTSRPLARYTASRGYSIGASSYFSLTSPQRNNAPYTKHGLPAHYDKGSPPPNVIIQTLQSLPRKDSVPFRFNYTSRESVNKDLYDPSMSSVRLEEYHNVTSKPIIIGPPAEGLSSTASRRARLSKYMSSSVDLALSSKDNDFILSDPKRPDKPPNYQEALERSLMIKHNSMPSDKVHVKTMTESGQASCEQRNMRSSETQTAFINPFSAPLPSKDPSLDVSTTTVTSNQTSINCAECSILRSSSRDCGSEDSPQKRRTSGYLDMSSVSQSFQKDVPSGRETRTEVRTARNSLADARSKSSSRCDDKLLHCPSSSEGSVLGNNSSVFDTRATTSAITSGIPSASTSIAPSHRSTRDSDLHQMSYSKQLSPVKPDDNNQSNRVSGTMGGAAESVDNVTVKKDPQKVYLQSKQIYEQKHSPVILTPKKSSTSTLSSPIPNSDQPLPSDKIFKSTQHALLALSSRDINTHKSSIQSSIIQNSHISRSVSVEHLTTKSGQRKLQDEQKIPNIQSGSDESNDTTQQPRDFKTELHQNFLRAKSCFSQSQSEQQNSSLISTQNLATYSENKIKKQLPRATSLMTTTEDMSVESALAPGSRTKLSSKPISNPHQSSVSEIKKEIHWSVKDLKSIYDKSKDNNVHSSIDNTREPSHPSTQCSPLSSENPSPLRSTQDFSNAHTSPTGSRNNEMLSKVGQIISKAAAYPHKSGPQNAVYDSPCSSSSSEDICGVTVTKSSMLEDSSEELSDYTNITYV